MKIEYTCNWKYLDHESIFQDIITKVMDLVFINKIKSSDITIISSTENLDFLAYTNEVGLSVREILYRLYCIDIVSSEEMKQQWAIVTVR